MDSKKKIHLSFAGMALITVVLLLVTLGFNYNQRDDLRKLLEGKDGKGQEEFFKKRELGDYRKEPFLALLDSVNQLNSRTEQGSMFLVNETTDEIIVSCSDDANLKKRFRNAFACGIEWEGGFPDQLSFELVSDTLVRLENRTLYSLINCGLGGE